MTPVARSIALALICLLTFGLYAIGIGGPFLMDDYGTIHPLATRVNEGTNWLQILVEAPPHIRQRPVSNFTFLITQVLHASPSPNGAYYKTGNILLHLACSLLIFLVARRLAIRWGAAPMRADLVGILTAGFFALHPLLVSTVLYPVQRMAQLATFFSLLAILFYLKWREALEKSSASRQHVLLWSTVASIALAVLSKETGALAPLLILATEITAHRWPETRMPYRPAFERGFALLCLGPIVLGLIALIAGFSYLTAGYAGRDFTMLERALTEVNVMYLYLSQIFIPDPSRMGLHWDDFPATRQLNIALMFKFAGILSAIVAALLFRRKAPAFSFAVLWFFGGHLLESSVAPLELVFEHRNYLPMFGPALLLAWFVTKPAQLRFTALAALPVLTFLAVQTGTRVYEWRDYKSWVSTEARNHPESMRAAYSYVNQLVRANDMTRAKEVVSKTRRLHPDDSQLVLFDIALLCRQGVSEHSLQPAQRQLVTTGRLTKDTFHAYNAIHDRAVSGACDTSLLTLLRDFSELSLSNDAVKNNPAALSAWTAIYRRAQLQGSHDNN